MTLRERAQSYLKLADKASSAPWVYDGCASVWSHGAPPVGFPAVSAEPIDYIARGYLSSRYTENLKFIAASRTEGVWAAQRLSEALDVLEQIETWTRNPREYQPSLYSINHLAREFLEGSER